MFKVGDKAVYPSHGLVTITGIQKQEISGVSHQFLILKVIDSDITVMIPKNSVQAKELRPLAKKNEIKNLWSLIKGKTNKDKGKNYSHTGGNSRPLKDDLVRKNGKWVRKVSIMEGNK